MNYLEIINATLIELNYVPVNAFGDLNKIEHKRLMNIINRLNKEICNLNSNFYFRQKIKKMSLFADRCEYTKNFSGKINKVIGKNGLYNFEKEYTKFHTNGANTNTYGIYGNKILFNTQDDKVKIFYSTNDFVIDEYDELKSDFNKETDKSIIPDCFSERLFINGAAYNFKQNTAHPKYVHWKKEYDTAIAELLSEAKSIAHSNLQIDGGFRQL